MNVRILYVPLNDVNVVTVGDALLRAKNLTKSSPPPTEDNVNTRLDDPLPQQRE